MHLLLLPKDSVSICNIINPCQGKRMIRLGKRDARLGKRDVCLGKRIVRLGKRDARLGKRDVRLGKWYAQLYLVGFNYLCKLFITMLHL